jgi:hypothetical protein
MDGMPVARLVDDSSIQWRFSAFSLRAGLHCSAFALPCIRAQSHRSCVLRMKAGRRFAMRKVSPAFRFAEPLPSVLRIKRGAVAAQQFHVTTAY